MQLPLGTSFSGRGLTLTDLLLPPTRKRLNHVAGFLCSSGAGQISPWTVTPLLARCPPTRPRSLKSSQRLWALEFGPLTPISDLGACIFPM